MTASRFPHLFSEIALGRTVVKNRIVSTGHHTHHAHGAPSDRLVAYQEARARGGAGLIVVEVAAIHEGAQFSPNLLQATSVECVPGYRKLARAVQGHGARIFGQLFHPGREIQSTADGMMAVAHAPSAVPNERFHIMPRPMPEAMIEEVIAGFGRGAGYLVEAGLDGIEIVASHSYLPAQFLNPRLNLRTDRWGGSFENRLRFLKEAIAAARRAIGDATLGMRISGDELDPAQGLDGDEVAAICRALAPGLDYVSVVAGMSSTLGSSIHIVGPMGLPAGYVAPYARRVKEATGLPTIATGRINQPQVAEAMLAAGDADLCGMTRAMICDPEMPAKTAGGSSTRSAPASAATRPASATATRACRSPASSTRSPGASRPTARSCPRTGRVACWSRAAGRRGSRPRQSRRPAAMPSRCASAHRAWAARRCSPSACRGARSSAASCRTWKARRVAPA